MKYTQFFSLILAITLILSVFGRLSGEIIPTAQALVITDRGTELNLDPGSHGLIIEDIDTKRITSNSKIRKLLASRGIEQDEFDLYEDFTFWEASIKVKNNFPMDLYGLNIMLNAYNPNYTRNEMFFLTFGHTSCTLDEADLPDGFDFNEPIIKSGDTFVQTFTYSISGSSYKSEYGDCPKYLHADWYEFWTEDECIMNQRPQISPFFELDDYEKAAEKYGISVDDIMSFGADRSREIEVTGVELISIDPNSIPKDEKIRVGYYTIQHTDISKEDSLLQLNVRVKNISGKDLVNPGLDLLFYNKDGNMVHRDCDYSCNGTIAAGKEATFSIGYYYAEDPYYIPYSIRETFGTRVFQAPIPQQSTGNLRTESNTFSAGTYHTVFLKNDSTVGAAGYTAKNRCKVDSWQNIIAVDAASHTVGLKSDGTVVAAGPNGKKQCNVTKWKDIIAIAAGSEHTVGLKSNGTVVATGNKDNKRLEVNSWQDIIAIDAGSATTYGLKSDGTVVAAGSNSSGQKKVTEWKQITAISAGNTHVAGLKADGTVVAEGSNSFGECNTSGWTNIIAIAAGNQFTIGLKSDGTVVATGNNKDGQCNIEDWSNIISISAGMYHVIGLCADGHYITAGSNGYGQCDLT